MFYFLSPEPFIVKLKNNWVPLVTTCDESHYYERSRRAMNRTTTNGGMFVKSQNQDFRGYLFNVLENYDKRIVSKSTLKCYTSVTFGVQFASATNIVTVRVHRRSGPDSFFPKKEFGGKCNIWSTSDIRVFVDLCVLRFL